MGLHLLVVELDRVEENLHELPALEVRFDVKRLCYCRVGWWGECHLSHLVCDLVFGAENGHNRYNNCRHILCDSLLGHSIFVCILFLGPGKDQIYLDSDFDIAKFSVSSRKCRF